MLVYIPLKVYFGYIIYFYFPSSIFLTNGCKQIILAHVCVCVYSLKIMLHIIMQLLGKFVHILLSYGNLWRLPAFKYYIDPIDILTTNQSSVKVI